MDGWMEGWMGGWMDGWMDEWVDGWMDGRIIGSLLERRSRMESLHKLLERQEISLDWTPLGKIREEALVSWKRSRATLAEPAKREDGKPAAASARERHRGRESQHGGESLARREGVWASRRDSLSWKQAAVS